MFRFISLPCSNAVRFVCLRNMIFVVRLRKLMHLISNATSYQSRITIIKPYDQSIYISPAYSWISQRCLNRTKQQTLMTHDPLEFPCRLVGSPFLFTKAITFLNVFANYNLPSSFFLTYPTWTKRNTIWKNVLVDRGYVTSLEGYVSLAGLKIQIHPKKLNY